MAATEQTVDRLARRYGEVMNVEDLAHLIGVNEDRLRRWLVVSPDYRTLRGCGRKLGRRVIWPVVRVAEFISRPLPPRRQARKAGKKRK